MTTSPPDPAEDDLERPPPLDAASVHCLNRTRAAVLNVIIVAGSLLVVSGFAVREFDFGFWRLPEVPARRAAYGTLIGLVFVSTAARRILGSRSALREPRTRGARFYLAHLVAALIGALAVPLGFAYGVAVRPDVREIAPFWVAGMALGFLALPRDHELQDFDEPMAGPPRPARDDGPPEPSRPRRPRR